MIDGDMERGCAQASGNNEGTSTGTVGCSDSANNIGCSSQNASRKSENDVGCMVGGRQTLYEITNYVLGPKSLPHNANILQT